MAVVKCDKCSKNITKTKPGLECGRCEKIVHLNTTCAGLSNKQLTALRATDNLEWTCQECRDASPKRRSVIIPNEDDEIEEEELQFISSGNLHIDVKKLLKDISADVEKTIKRELKDMQHSLQMHSDLMQDAVDKVDAMAETILELKKKNNELTNKNKNLEMRVGALEQRVQDFEQQKLLRHLEIYHLPADKDENPAQIAKAVAEKLNQPTVDVEQAQRLPGKRDIPGPIRVTLKTEVAQQKWLEAFKEQQKQRKYIKVKEVSAGTSNAAEADKTVVVREALTPYNKQLLWHVKQELKDTYRYIWIKKGILRVRKEGDENKPTIVRSMEDINNLK